MRKYESVASWIKQQAEIGKLRPGKPLPSIRALSETFLCSKATVIRAYQELEQAGLIYAIPQIGFFLCEGITQDKKPACGLLDFASPMPDARVFSPQEFDLCLREASRKYQEELFRYHDVQGLESLRKLLAEDFQRAGVYANAASIFLVNGAQQATGILASMPFPNGKDLILLEEPSYTGLVNLIKWRKLPIATIPRDEKGLDLPSIERHFRTQRVKFFYTTPRFHNPLGTSLTREEKKRLAHLAQKYDVYIIEDDYLSELRGGYDMPLHYYAQGLPERSEHNRVIYLKTFSKILLPELRIAAIVLPSPLQKEFLRQKQSVDFGSSLLLQGALEICITHGLLALMQKRAALYGEKQRIFRHFLQEELAKAAPHLGNHLLSALPKTGFFLSFPTPKGSAAQLQECLLRAGMKTGSVRDNYFSDFAEDRIKLCLSSLPEGALLRGASILGKAFAGFPSSFTKS